MAEINIQSSKGSRRKTVPPRVELASMVDLGFLLITFFMFTTALSEPKVMDINMPLKAVDNKMAFIDTSTLTIIPTNGHRFIYYAGILESAYDLHIASQKDIRDVIIAKQQAIRRLTQTFSVSTQTSCHYKT